MNASACVEEPRAASEVLLGAEPATVRALAAEHGSPLLLLSAGAARQQCHALVRALPGVDVYYSLKPLPHPAVVRALRDEGASFDLASTGEVDLVRVLDVDPERCIHTHPVKWDRDLRHALDFGCRTFVFDNPYELAKLGPYRREIELLLRISFPNPEVQCDLSLKYGVAAEDALRLLREATAAGFAVRGLSFHVGSQVADPTRFVAAIATCRWLFDRAAREGIALATLDIGGGFPIPYVEPVSDIADFCAPAHTAGRPRGRPTTRACQRRGGAHLRLDRCHLREPLAGRDGDRRLVASPMMGAYTAASATDFHLLRRAEVVELASGEVALTESSASWPAGRLPEQVAAA